MLICYLISIDPRNWPWTLLILANGSFSSHCFYYIVKVVPFFALSMAVVVLCFSDACFTATSVIFCCARTALNSLTTTGYFTQQHTILHFPLAAFKHIPPRVATFLNRFSYSYVVKSGIILPRSLFAFFSAANTLRALYSSFSSAILRSVPLDLAKIGCYEW